MHALAEKLNRALTDLGDTPDAIAAYLEGQGVVGSPFGSTHCPVAKYLLSLGPFGWVCVSEAQIRVAEAHFKPWIVAALPPAVQHFISRFDGGHYPALEAK